MNNLPLTFLLHVHLPDLGAAENLDSDRGISQSMSSDSDLSKGADAEHFVKHIVVQVHLAALLGTVMSVGHRYGRVLLIWLLLLLLEPVLKRKEWAGGKADRHQASKQAKGGKRAHQIINE